MSKLHELLAVESDLEETSKKILEEAFTTFVKKGNHFEGYHKTLKMLDEERSGEEDGAEEHKALVTTVPDKLEYVRKSLENYYNIILQKEATNQEAKADLEIAGVVIAKDLPATFLLGMETRLKKLRPLIESIPTLDPGVEWIADLDQGSYVYKSKYPERKQKQEKTNEFVVVTEATPQHKAQYEKVSKNFVCGTYSTQYWSGKITPGQKSLYLSRLDNLIQAVKKARQRANNTEIVKRKIGKELLDYLLLG